MSNHRARSRNSLIQVNEFRVYFAEMRVKVKIQLVRPSTCLYAHVFLFFYTETARSLDEQSCSRVTAPVRVTVRALVPCE